MNRQKPLPEFTVLINLEEGEEISNTKWAGDQKIEDTHGLYKFRELLSKLKKILNGPEKNLPLLMGIHPKIDEAIAIRLRGYKIRFNRNEKWEWQQQYFT